MAEAFIVRRGGGGGSGATLVVTSAGAGTVTVSNSTLGKSYSKTVTAGGSVTFKGLKTGEWTVTVSNGTQTTTKPVTINADYSVSVAYFSATISVTYPATSTCVVTNSSGQTVASDTNTGSSTKTWTATVGATGTYTVTATATDGSGKSKSQSVSIKAAGQVESVSLSYKIYLYNKGDECTDITGGWVGKNVGTYYGIGTFTKNPNSATASIVKMQSIWACTNNKISLTDANTIHANILSVDNTVPNKIATILAIATELNDTHTAITSLSNGQTGDVSIDVSNITGDYYLYFYVASETNSASITFDEVYME